MKTNADGSIRTIPHLRIRRQCQFLGLARSSYYYQPGPGREIYPYLLLDLIIERPNQVWSSDITYVPMRRGFLYPAP